MIKSYPKSNIIRIDHNRPKYKRLQQQVLERDNHECQVCGWGVYYTQGIHHVKFLSQGGSDTLGNMVTLCDFRGDNCHAGFHELALYKGEIIDGQFLWVEI